MKFNLNIFGVKHEKCTTGFRIERKLGQYQITNIIKNDSLSRKVVLFFLFKTFFETTFLYEFLYKITVISRTQSYKLFPEAYRETIERSIRHLQMRALFMTTVL